MLTAKLRKEKKIFFVFNFNLKLSFFQLDFAESTNADNSIGLSSISLLFAKKNAFFLH